MSITNCTFENNTAQLETAEDGTWTKAKTDDAIPVGGGAISLGAVSNSAIASISNTTFTNNSSGVNGGAIGTRLGKDANNSAARLDIAATFVGNSATANGGAIYNTFYTSNDLGKGDGVTVTGIFQQNTASKTGGAIYNDGAKDKSGANGGVMTVTDSTFSGNTAADGGAICNTGTLTVNSATFTGNSATTNGGAIYNATNASLTFTGANTFSGNTANGQANDIWNTGKISVNDGVTTLNGGLTQVNGGITINTNGTLDMASGSTLTIQDSGTLTINGGTFVADFDQLLEDYSTANTANGISDTSIIGTSGNLNLRLNGKTYTLTQYNQAKAALLAQSGEKAALNFLNARLGLDPGEELVAGATTSGSGEVTISMAPVVATSTQSAKTAASDGNTIASVPNRIVSVVKSDDTSKELLKADTITVDNSTFTAGGFQIAGTVDADDVATLKVTNNSSITLAGGEAGFTGVVNASNEAVATSVAVDSATLTVGLEGNTSAQNLTLNKVTVTNSGAFAVAGNGLDTTQIAADTLTQENNTTVTVDNATLTVQTTNVSGGVLSITNAAADLGTVTFTDGVIFVDPSYSTQTFAGGNVGGKLLVSDGSVVNVASGLDNLQELAQKAGLTTTALASGGFTVGTGQSMLALGQSLTLGSGGKIIVDAGVDASGAIGGAAVSDAAYFGNNSLLVVNGNTINGATAAINIDGTSSGSATLSVQNGARLLIANAMAGQTYTIIANASNKTTAFNGAAYTDAGATGWKGANLLTSSDMITLTSKNGTVFTARSEDAATVFPRLSDGMVDAVNTLYRRQLNNVDSPDMGVRFLSRATDKRYLGKDRDAATSTIESAARMALAGAVPQMTRMASDAATNAVVNRLGLANPADGIQAMDAEGRIVDRNTTGFALWIAPLWQNMQGWGMDAGHLDYGFSGNLGGVSLGADYTFENAIRAGITFNIGGGYAESSGGDLASTRNNMNFWGLGAYVGWNCRNFGLMADVAYTSTWNDLSQDMDARMGMGDLEADVRASALSAGVRAEYKLETSVLDVIPHIGVRYMSLNTWGHDVESGGGTLLEADGFHQDIWTFPVGITFSKALQMGNGWAFTPSVDFSVIPAAGDIEARHDVAFTGLPGSHEVETQMMDYLTWQGGLGLKLANENMSIGVNYTLQAGQNSTGHGLFGSFRYEF